MLTKILKLKLKVIGICIVAIILIQIISAYFFGILAEKQLDLQFKHLTNTSLITVVKHKYTRGWMSSHEEVVLSVNKEVLKNIFSVLPGGDKESAATLAQQNYTISYTTNISNGLFAGWMHGDIMPTIAYAQTKLTLPEKLDKILNKFFNNQPALNIVNLIYPNKAGKYVITSPSFNYDEALSGVKVTWGGLKLKVSYNSGFDRFANQLQVPLFDMLAPTKGELGFNGLDYSANSGYSVNNIKVGDTHLALDSIKIQMQESNNSVSLKLGEVVHLLTGVNSADFLDGLDVINPTNFVLNGVTYNATSQDVDNLFAANAKASFVSLQSNNAKYGPMNFDFSLQHIAAPAFSRLTDALDEMASQDQTNPDSKEKAIATLKTNMTPILVESPVVSLNSFSLVTPSGTILLSGTATTQGFTESDINNQAAFMSKLKLNVNFSVPKSTMAYLFLLQMKYFLTAGNVQMDKQSSDALAKVVNILLDNQLQVWLKKGYLSESNNQLSSKLTMESSVVSLNGVATK